MHRAIRFPAPSLRARLLAASILVVLLSGATISAITTWSDYASQRQEAVSDLDSIASLKQDTLRHWLAGLHTPLATFVSDDEMLKFVEDAVGTPPGSPSYQAAVAHLRHDLTHVLKGEAELFDEVFLADVQGRVVVSSNSQQEGQSIAESDFFGPATQRDYTSAANYSPALGYSTFVVVHRIADSDGAPIALLAARARLTEIDQMMADTSGLHATGQTYLVSAGGVMLTSPRPENPSGPPGAVGFRITSSGLDAARTSQSSGTGEYPDYRNVPVVGVYHWIPELQAVLFAEQTQAETYGSAFTLLRINSSITLGVLIFAIVISLFLVQTIIAPLDELTKTAEQIEGGNLRVQAAVERGDEIGRLARAFNRMTTRLRQVIGDLEKNVAELRRAGEERERLLDEQMRARQKNEQLAAQLERNLEELERSRDVLEARVRERTAELASAYESERQAHRVADTMREATLAFTRSLDLDKVLETLLDYLVRLVPYDNAAILLLESEYKLAFRAIRCGDQPAAAVKSGAIVKDVAEDPLIRQIIEKGESVLIPNTRLAPGACGDLLEPGVRCWIGVPLIANKQVIGLCSLEQGRPNAFTEGHLRLVEATAGQAGIAVQNAWLFEQVGIGRERMQSLSRRLVEVQESERRYIARELHDEAGQALTGIKVGLRVLEEEASSAELVTRVARLRRIADEVLENLHRLAMHLRPATLDQLGLVPAIEEYAQDMSDKFGLIVDCDTSRFSGLRPPLAVETALYRIVQEALTNIVRHAQATRVEVILEARPRAIRLSIGDNGIGFNPEEAYQTSRLGLIGMRERTEMLGGTLAIESAPEQGTSVLVEIPYESASVVSG